MLTLYNARTLARTKAQQTGADYVVVFILSTGKYNVMSYAMWELSAHNNYECLYASDGSCHN